MSLNADPSRERKCRGKSVFTRWLEMIWVYVWLGVTAGSLILEFITNEMVSIWFAGGGVVAMILAACGLSWYIHLPVFIVFSLVLMLSFRKLVMKKLDRGDVKTNADAILGKEYKLLTPIGFNEPGTIKVSGIIWDAITEDEEKSVPEGTMVRIKDIKGNKYIVEEVK